MDAKEFVLYYNEHAPSTCGRLTLEHLKQWDDLEVLSPHPEYYRGDVYKAMGLMKWEQSLQRQAPTQGIQQEKAISLPTTSGIIYQVLSILGEATNEEEMKEKAAVRLALMRTGLISTLGFIYINFSPLNGTTLESLLTVPAYKSAFEEAAALNQTLILRGITQFVEDKTGKEITLLDPVLFIQGVKKKVVYSTLIFDSHGRLIGPEQYISLRCPLYEEFLDTNIQSSNDIMNFMATHLMIGSFGVPLDKDEIDFIRTTQRKMRLI